MLLPAGLKPPPSRAAVAARRLGSQRYLGLRDKAEGRGILLGSGATLFQAGKGGELQDTRDRGPHLATCSTGDNCAGITSVPWSLSHRPHPRCAPKLSAARHELVWGLSTVEGATGDPKALLSGVGRAGDLGGRGGARPGEEWNAVRCR